MRTLERNKTVYWYALYTGVVKLTDDDGRYTGEQEVIYTEPVKARGNISAAKGDAYSAQFGTFVDYDSVLIADKTQLDENSVLWIGVDPSVAPYNYRVRRVSRSLNGVAVAIKKVDVSEQ